MTAARQLVATAIALSSLFSGSLAAAQPSSSCEIPKCNLTHGQLVHVDPLSCCANEFVIKGDEKEKAVGILERDHWVVDTAALLAAREFFKRAKYYYEKVIERDELAVEPLPAADAHLKALEAWQDINEGRYLHARELLSNLFADPPPESSGASTEEEEQKVRLAARSIYKEGSPLRELQRWLPDAIPKLTVSFAPCAVHTRVERVLGAQRTVIEPGKPHELDPGKYNLVQERKAPLYEETESIEIRLRDRRTHVLRDASASIARLKLVLDPGDARTSLDRRKLAKVGVCEVDGEEVEVAMAGDTSSPPTTRSTLVVLLEPGTRHDLAVHREGYESFRWSGQLRAGEGADLEATLVKIAPPSPPVDPFAVTAVATGVLAGLGLIGGGVFTGLTFATHSELEDKCKGTLCPPETEDTIDRGATYRTVSEVSFGVMAVSAIVSGISGGVALDDDGVSASVDPIVAPGMVGVAGRF